MSPWFSMRVYVRSRHFCDTRISWYKKSQSLSLSISSGFLPSNTNKIIIFIYLKSICCMSFKFYIGKSTWKIHDTCVAPTFQWFSPKIADKSTIPHVPYNCQRECTVNCTTHISWIYYDVTQSEGDCSTFKWNGLNEGKKPLVFFFFSILTDKIESLNGSLFVACAVWTNNQRGWTNWAGH